MQDETQTIPRLIKPKDASTYLAISERKLFDLSKSGTLPIVRLGRSVRYDLADLDSFIERAKARDYNG